MEGAALGRTALVGREEEIGRLKAWLKAASGGQGGAVILSGEAGIGKTRLVDETAAMAMEMGFGVMQGASSAEGAQPFLPFSQALGESLFRGEEHVSFAQVLVIDDAGLLVARASPQGSEGLDADIFAGMLTAVQNFVKDSFGDREGSLGRLEYGDLKVLMERTRGAILVAIFRGAEHDEMRTLLRSAAQRMGERFGEVLESWSGREELIAPVRAEAEGLTSARFLVRRNLEGVRLDAERNRISDQVLGELAARSRGSPQLLVIEDAHWADESSLFVLEYLARNAGTERLAILATMRPGEGAKASALATRMRAEGTAMEVEVLPIDEGGVAEMLRASLSPNDFPADLPARLARDCRGNPFFLTELLRQMLADGSIAIRDGSYTLSSATFAVPPTIEEMAQRRLEGLDPDTMTMAEYASCIGREFDVGMALSLRTLKDAHLALEKLRAHGIVAIDGTRASFAHALIQGAIYKNISPRWKGAYHRSLGEHIEGAFAGRLDEAAYELARHFSLTGEHSKAYGYCLRAGDKAVASYAVEQAAGFYDIALAAIPKLRDLPDPLESEMAVRERLGDVYHLSNYDRALELYASVIERSKSPGARARMRRKRCVVLDKKGDFEAALAEAVAGEADADDAERWRLALAKAWVLMRTGQYDRSIELCEGAARGLGRRSDAARDVAHARNIMGGCHWYKGEYAKALACYEESMRIREDTGDLRGLAATCNSLGTVLDDMGERDRALELYRKAEGLCEKMGEMNGLSVLYNNMGVTYRARGELDRALDLYQKSIRMRERLGNKDGVASSLNNLAIVYKEMGDLDKALDALRRSMALFERLGNQRGLVASYVSMGDALAERGSNDEAEGWYGKCIELSERLGAKNYIVEAKVGLADVCVALGRLAEGARLAGEAETMASGVGLKPKHAACLRVQGAVLAAEGRWDEAEAKFAASAVEFGDVAVEASKTVYEWGRMCAAKGDIERGRGMLEQAERAFRDRGIRLWAEKARKAQEQL